MEFPEIVRENILAQRQEEMQRFTDKRQLEMMLKLQSGHAQGDDSVSKAAKRVLFSLHISCVCYNATVGQHAIRGATKEKSKKLDELKAKRKLKDERKRVRSAVLCGNSESDDSRRGQTHPSGTGLHHQWTWRLRMRKRRMDSLPSLTRRKSEIASSFQR